MSAITAKASRKMKKYAVLTREPRCFLGSFDFSWEQRKFDEVFDCTVPNNTLSRAELSYDEGTVLNVHYGDVLIKYGSVLDVQKDDIPRIPHRCREDFNGALLQDGDVIIADTAEDETTGKACEIGNLQGSAIVSGLHTMVCRPRNRMALGYLGYYLNSNAYHHQLLPLMQGIKVLSLSRSNIQKTSVSYPIAVKEQQLIAYYFSQLDNLITLHQRKCANLCSPSQVVFSLLFATSTFSWEQRKLGDIASDMVAGGDIDKDLILAEGQYPVIANALTGDGIVGYYDKEYRVNAPAVTVTGRGDVGHAKARLVNFTPVVRLLSVKSEHDVFFLENAINTLKIVIESTGVPQLTVPQLAKYEVAFPRQLDEEEHIGAFFKQLDHLITLHQRECISFTGRADRLILTANKKRTTSSWEQRKLEDYLTVSAEKNTDNLYTKDDVLSVSGDFGVVNQIEFQGRSFAGASVSNYGVVHTGDVVYTKSPLKANPYGIIKANKGKTGIVSVLYGVYHTRENANADFIQMYFEQDARLNNYLRPLVNKGAKNTLLISDTDALEGEVCLAPTFDEQKAIGQFFTFLDNLITLHQRKPFLMKWRTSDANRNQTNRLVL